MNTAKQKLKLFLNDHKKIASNMRYRKSSNTLAFFSWSYVAWCWMNATIVYGV